MNNTVIVLLATGLLAGSVPLHAADYGAEDFLPTPEKPLSFNVGGRMAFPGATPITSWYDASTNAVAGAQNTNLLWKTEMPGHGTRPPIVFGGRVYVQYAFNGLMCLDARTGKELWRRDRHLTEAEKSLPVAERERIAVEEYPKLLANQMAVPKDDQKAAQAAQSAWKKSGMDNFGHQWCWMNLTPASDGRTVVALFPTGLIVAYDLDGQRRWVSAFAKFEQCDYKCHGCSPAIADGKTVVQYGPKVRCLNMEDGRTAWETDVDKDAARTWGQPTPGKVGNGWYVAMGSGTILRMDNGGPLKSNDINMCVSPILVGDTFHYWTLAERVVDGVEPKIERVWTSRDVSIAGSTNHMNAAKTEYRQQWYTQLCHADGFNHLGIGTQVASTGEMFWKRVGFIGDYGGSVVAGDWLTHATLKGAVAFYPLKDMRDPARAPNMKKSPIQTPALGDGGRGERVCAMPVFWGSNVYLRSTRYLWCFGPVTKK